jgi:Holliday junction resolvase RusA-like endonuclease
MNRVEFFVAGAPKAQPRPRAFTRHGRARVYDPGTAEGWKGQVALAAKAHRPVAPIGTAAALWLRFHFPRPQAHFGQRGLRSAAPCVHTGKPDADNLAKAVLDALVGIGLLSDDRFVWSLRVTKRYADGPPGCRVRLVW